MKIAILIQTVIAELNWRQKDHILITASSDDKIQQPNGMVVALSKSDNIAMAQIIKSSDRT